MVLQKSVDIILEQRAMIDCACGIYPTKKWSSPFRRCGQLFNNPPGWLWTFL